ncbi:uncharacterized protein E0L32_005772 [Thyridium curvatum]|uniref:Uncharacterized protein n=1 Tax=Thyridium curvatum TaxID=1093900 RepID=A0A507BAL2_9PEZI|nr:uncharacterized protein E0L32_005772 [Thyridium curvatum]TPX13828.1 hypothetical protein E0L32_005772 [Thyridium curvatum]
MSGPPPPPPPPHGEAPKTTAGGGLPPGKYDIFVIPEHSAGSGFLYLPSLRPNINSFIAGFASAMALIALGQSMAPAFQVWWANFQGMGNMGMMMLTIAVGLGAWSLGRQQNDGGGGPGTGGSGPTGGSGSHSGAGFGGASHGSASGSAPPPPPPNHGGPPPTSPPPPPQPDPPPQNEKPKSSWQQRAPPPTGTTGTESPKGAWARAREETRRKEEERRAQEEERKRREANAQRLKELREKEAREREQREKERREREAKETRDREERQRKEREEQERKEKENKELREKEQRERVQREQRARELREKLEREAKERERLKKEQEEKPTRVGSTYAFSAVGEKMSPWPNGKPPVATPPQPASPASAAKPTTTANSSTSSAQRPPAPTARSYAGTEDDAYSYRPYDRPKRPTHKKSNSDLSESSWAPSQSTARTTPPPSFRAPYSTKDPDKIVIKAVYGFLNQFAKTPSSQLISGFGSVTDGLILRITTEGLFIDDDVRGVAQREWDVKAWTLKLVEVWCPAHVAAIANSAAAAEPPLKPSGANTNNASFLHKMHQRRSAAASRGEPKTLVGDEADAHLADMLRECRDNCRLGLLGDSCFNAAFAAGSTVSSKTASSTNSKQKQQTGEWKTKGLHMLRATIRDQEGKRYLFVIGEEEGWKVAVGLQRLRRGTQTRALGVAGLSALETKNTLEVLGWGQ